MRNRWRRAPARLAAVAVGAKALLLLTASAALAQASTTSTTLPPQGSGARRITLPFVLLAVAGAALIVLMQRRVSRKLGDMFPTDPDGDGRPDRPDK